MKFKQTLTFCPSPDRPDAEIKEVISFHERDFFFSVKEKCRKLIRTHSRAWLPGAERPHTSKTRWERVCFSFWLWLWMNGQQFAPRNVVLHEFPLLTSHVQLRAGSKRRAVLFPSWIQQLYGEKVFKPMPTLYWKEKRRMHVPLCASTGSELAPQLSEPLDDANINDQPFGVFASFLFKKNTF